MFVNKTINCDGSFLKMSSEDAKKMAEKTLEWVKKRRADSKERAISNLIEAINDGFWHKLFHMRPATREQAIRALEADHWNFDYHFVHCIGYKNEDTANRILNACKHVTEFYISTEDLLHIS